MAIIEVRKSVMWTVECQRRLYPLEIFFQKNLTLTNPFFGARWPSFRVEDCKPSRTLLLEYTTFHAKIKNRFGFFNAKRCGFTIFFNLYPIGIMSDGSCSYVSYYLCSVGFIVCPFNPCPIGTICCSIIFVCIWDPPNC